MNLKADLERNQAVSLWAPPRYLLWKKCQFRISKTFAWWLLSAFTTVWTNTKFPRETS